MEVLCRSTYQQHQCPRAAHVQHRIENTGLIELQTRKERWEEIGIWCNLQGVEWEEFNRWIYFSVPLFLTCGGELGFFSADVDASRIGLILESMNDEGFGVGKLMKEKKRKRWEKL